MSNSDIKTTPRFMTTIQTELKAVTVRMSDVDYQPIKDAETVFFDRGIVRNVFDYLNDNPIDPEWYSLVPDSVFVGTELPIICSLPSSYEGKYYLTGERLEPDVKQFSADMECVYFVKNGKVDALGGNIIEHSLGYGRCAGLRESYRYSANYLKNKTVLGGGHEVPPSLYYPLINEFNNIAKARTSLAPIIAFDKNGNPHEVVASDRQLSEHVPYMSPSAITRLLASVDEMTSYSRVTDAFILAFLMTAYAMGENLIDGYAECEKVTVKPPKTEIKRHSGRMKTTLLMHLKPVEDTPQPKPDNHSKTDVTDDGMITGTVEIITPGTAKEMLGANTNNRNVSRKQVELFARTMSQQAWQLNGEAIKFSTSGRLLDGQHRLLACVESGVPFRTLVIRGLPDETQETMDAGKTRTMSNVLELQGKSSTGQLATIGRIIYISDQLGVEAACVNNMTPTRNELLDFINSTPQLETVVRQAGLFYSRSGHLLPASMYALLWWTFNEIDGDACEEFFDMLATGANLSEGSPILVLRNSLFEIGKRGAHSDRASRRRIVGMTIKAWSKWRAGQTVRILKFSPSEPFPDAI